MDRYLRKSDKEKITITLFEGNEFEISINEILN